MVILSSVNIQYSYQDGTHALRGVSLDIKRGEFFAILGPNGSGKTTLLKHFNGLLKPSAGEVLLNQKNIRRYPTREIFQKVGIVFQDPNDQLFAQTVWEDVAFGPSNLDLSKTDIEQRVKGALTLVGMEPFVNKSVSALSYGQKKRVCIAGVLAMKPDVLLLDEPTCGLDPAGVTSIMTLLKELNGQYGITIIMATNTVDLVPVYMDCLAIMYNGNILLKGNPKTVFSNPQKVRQACLELPQIGQLMQALRGEGLFDTNHLPLTIGEARKFLIEKIYLKDNV